MKVGVIGLGKLGLPYALALADAGHDVAIWDHNDAARHGEGAPGEPHVGEQLRAHPLRKVAPKHMWADGCRVVFIVVPTPSNPDGSFNPSNVMDAMWALGRPALAGCVVAVVSTLSPGTSARDLAPVAAERGYELVYSPCLIALGSVWHDLHSPDVVMIGSERVVSGVPSRGAARVAFVLGEVARTAKYRHGSWESVEVAKLATNVFLTVKIAFTNQIAAALRGMPGEPSITDIMGMLSAQRMFGTRGLTAGAGFGGPCLPRDGRAFDQVLATSEPTLAESARVANGILVYQVVGMAGVYHSDSKTFHVLGRSYKPGATHEIESFGDRLVAELIEAGGEAAEITEANHVIIAMPESDLYLAESIKPGATVVDLWRTHGYLRGRRADITYIQFGEPLCRPR